MWEKIWPSSLSLWRTTLPFMVIHLVLGADQNLKASELSGVLFMQAHMQDGL